LHEGGNLDGYEDEQLLDIRKVAALTGFSVGTLYHWVSQRRIPFIWFSNRCVRFRRCDIQKWISEKLVMVK
jgi:excisionase family DNA binding protein